MEDELAAFPEDNAFATLTTATLVLGLASAAFGAAAASRCRRRARRRARSSNAPARPVTQAGQTAAPPPDALRAITPEAIVNALTNGKMAVQGATLSPAEHRAVAQFITGRAPVGSNRVRAHSPIAARRRRRRPIRRAVRAGWRGADDATNGRYAPKGGLTAADLPQLKLKWAFGYDGATSARVQPALAGGKLFVASDNAELHALNPKTGCTYWTYKAESGVRSALTVGPYKSAGATRLRGVLRRPEGQRLRRRRGHRPADLEAQGRRPPAGGDHRRHRRSTTARPSCRRRG